MASARVAACLQFIESPVMVTARRPHQAHARSAAVFGRHLDKVDIGRQCDNKDCQTKRDDEGRIGIDGILSHFTHGYPKNEDTRNHGGYCEHSRGGKTEDEESDVPQRGLDALFQGSQGEAGNKLAGDRLTVRIRHGRCLSHMGAVSLRICVPVIESKEGGCTAGVQEDNRPRRIELAGTDVIDEAGHGLCGVDGIQEHPFSTRHEF